MTSAAIAGSAIFQGLKPAEGEARALAAHSNTLVVRTSAFFGPYDEFNFVTLALRTLAAGESFHAPGDVIVSPTYVPELVDVVLDLLIDGERGVWHLANATAVTWAEFAEAAAGVAGVPTKTLARVPAASLGLAAARPAYSALGSERGSLLSTLDNALARYASERGRLGN